jgi:hypothetical protein
MPATRTAFPPRRPPKSNSTGLIDLEHDDLRPVAAIVRARLGKRVNPSTIWRWRLHGVAGVRLECVYVAGIWCSTEAAFGEFIRQTSQAKGAPVSSGSNATRRRQVARKQAIAAGLVEDENE